MKTKKSAKSHPQPVDALVFPRFSGISTFLRLPAATPADDLDIAVIGIPFDGGTTYRPGPRFGPRAVREQSAIIRPWNPVLNLNPFEKWRMGECYDLSINPLCIEDAFARITSQLNEVLATGARTARVGGDHSILLPTLRSIHKRFGKVALVQLDAHNDSWGGYFGSPHSHGTPVRRAVEEGLLCRNRPASWPARLGVCERRFRFQPQARISGDNSEEFHHGGIPLVKRALKKLKDARSTSRSTSM